MCKVREVLEPASLITGTTLFSALWFSARPHHLSLMFSEVIHGKQVLGAHHPLETDIVNFQGAL